MSKGVFYAIFLLSIHFLFLPVICPWQAPLGEAQADLKDFNNESSFEKLNT